MSGTSVEASALEARFSLRRSPARITRNPWLVIDNGAPVCEDAVIYHFSSKAQAAAFRRQMIAERAK